jgi:hypothetical protein
MIELPSGRPGSLAQTLVMRRALWMWFVAVVVGVASLGLAIVLVTADNNPGPSSPDAWLVASAAMVGLVVPLCVFAHGWMFRRHWHDGLVAPGGYIRAEAMLWAGLLATAIVIAVGAIQRQTLMPDLLLAGPTVGLLLLSWPSGWAMRHDTPREFEDDDEILHFNGPDL